MVEFSDGHEIEPLCCKFFKFSSRIILKTVAAKTCNFTNLFNVFAKTPDAIHRYGLCVAFTWFAGWRLRKMNFQREVREPMEKGVSNI